MRHLRRLAALGLLLAGLLGVVLAGPASAAPIAYERHLAVGLVPGPAVLSR